MERKNFELLKQNLNSLGYEVSCFETASEASTYLDEQIDKQTVGFAGSMTLEEMGLYELLSNHNQVFWHHRIPIGKTSNEVRIEANASTIYISSVNGIAESGEIINIVTVQRVHSENPRIYNIVKIELYWLVIFLITPLPAITLYVQIILYPQAQQYNLHI